MANHQVQTEFVEVRPWTCWFQSCMFQAKRLQISATTSVRHVALGFLVSIMHASVQNARCRVAVKAWWPQPNPRVLFARAAFFLLHRGAVQIYELVVAFYTASTHTTCSQSPCMQNAKQVHNFFRPCVATLRRLRGQHASTRCPSMTVQWSISSHCKDSEQFLRSQLHLLASTCQPGLHA